MRMIGALRNAAVFTTIIDSPLLSRATSNSITRR